MLAFCQLFAVSWGYDEIKWTQPLLSRSLVSLALPDDCIALYHVWYLGRNVLPINQDRSDLYVYREVVYISAIQFWYRPPRVSIRLHSFQGIVPKKTEFTSNTKCKFRVPQATHTSNPLAKNLGSSHEHFRFSSSPEQLRTQASSILRIKALL